MNITPIAVVAALALGSGASAQDGAYFGLGLGTTSSQSAPEGSSTDVSANDFALALTAGYRFPSSGPANFGIEGNLDLLSGNLMDRNGVDACPGFGPTWCEIDAIARLRGTISSDTGGGRLIGSLGVVVVSGRLEDGPGLYADGTGNGLSVGVGWESLNPRMPVRIDLNYDKIENDDANNFDRSLKIVGLRVSYMF